MPTELIIAGLAAAAVLLITIGVSSRPPKDAVQARLEQLVVQPKTLEEFELQQPFAERVLRPVVKRLSKIGRRGDQGGIIARTDARLEKAGYPGGLRGADGRIGLGGEARRLHGALGVRGAERRGQRAVEIHIHTLVTGRARVRDLLLSGGRRGAPNGSARA